MGGTVFSYLHFRAAEGKVEICWYYFKMFQLSSLFVFTHTVIGHRKKNKKTGDFFVTPRGAEQLLSWLI